MIGPTSTFYDGHDQGGGDEAARYEQWVLAYQQTQQQHQLQQQHQPMTGGRDEGDGFSTMQPGSYPREGDEVPGRAPGTDLVGQGSDSAHHFDSSTTTTTTTMAAHYPPIPPHHSQTHPSSHHPIQQQHQQQQQQGAYLFGSSQDPQAQFTTPNSNQSSYHQFHPDPAWNRAQSQTHPQLQGGDIYGGYPGEEMYGEGAYGQTNQYATTTTMSPLSEPDLKGGLLHPHHHHQHQSTTNAGSGLPGYGYGEGSLQPQPHPASMQHRSHTHPQSSLGGGGGVGHLAQQGLYARQQQPSMNHPPPSQSQSHHRPGPLPRPEVAASIPPASASGTGKPASKRKRTSADAVSPSSTSKLTTTKPTRGGKASRGGAASRGGGGPKGKGGGGGQVYTGLSDDERHLVRIV